MICTLTQQKQLQHFCKRLCLCVCMSLCCSVCRSSIMNYNHVYVYVWFLHLHVCTSTNQEIHCAYALRVRTRTHRQSYRHQTLFGRRLVPLCVWSLALSVHACSRFGDDDADYRQWVRWQCAMNNSTTCAVGARVRQKLLLFCVMIIFVLLFKVLACFSVWWCSYI